MADAPLPMGLADVSADWLTSALRAGGGVGKASVTAFQWEVLGEGAGFIGQLARIRLEYDREEPAAPRSLIAKFPSPIGQNRGFGVVARLYETEIRFYRELADALPVRVPRCFFGAFDPEPASSRAVSWVLQRLPGSVTMALLDRLVATAAKSTRRYALLLEDLDGARVGDQVSGCTVEEARVALQALARFHASTWNSPLVDRAWINRVDADAALVYGLFRRTWPLFTQRYAAILPNLDEIGAWLERHGLALLRRFSQRPYTLLHGDYRLDNLFFDPGRLSGPESVTMIDWQAIRVGNAMQDVAYFIRPNVATALVDVAEEPLLRDYHAALVAAGVTDYPWEACERDYALAQAWLAMQGAFLLGALDLSHERGVELIDRAVERSSPALSRVIDTLTL
ncbi:MAG: hypothetical protein FJZ92_03670 [Chloroflexi bacterium]|nr:hypothetical protein [Chloroflexota bacterium]